MKWPLTYAFLATGMVILGFLKKEVTYLITAIFIYIIAIIWLLKEGASNK